MLDNQPPSPSHSPQSPVEAFWNRVDWLLRGVGLTLGGIRSVFRKEMIQLLRDRYLLAFIILLPIVQLMVTGLAVQKDVKHVETIVCNYDNRNASIELLKAFNNSTFFNIDAYVDTDQKLIKKIRKGKYMVGIVIPPDYSNKIMAAEEPAGIDLIVDGTNATVAKTLINAANVIVANHAGQTMAKYRLETVPETAGLIHLNSQPLYNEDLKSANYLVPGILTIIMHMMTILFTSVTIVRERESGTLEQLMVTPVRAADLMVGKVIPYAVIGYLDMILTLGVMVWFFDIPISGNFWFLSIASIIFMLTSLGMGLIVSTLCRSQVQSIQLTLAILIPSIFLTGFVFPIDPLPWFIKLVSYLLPMTYYLDIIRGVVIKGTGFAELWTHILWLAVLSVVVIRASIAMFRKQIA